MNIGPIILENQIEDRLEILELVTSSDPSERIANFPQCPDNRRYVAEMLRKSHRVWRVVGVVVGAPVAAPTGTSPSRSELDEVLAEAGIDPVDAQRSRCGDRLNRG